MNFKSPILLLLIANSISGISQGITMLAVPWYFTGIINKPVLFQKIYFTVTLISIFWGLLAGTFVDRYNRKKIFIWINVVGLLVLSTAATLGYLLPTYHWIFPAIVYATTFFIYNIHFPALYAFAQEITPAAQYGKITSKLEVQGQLTWTISGGVAALLISGLMSQTVFGFQIPAIQPWSIQSIFFIDALTYLVSLYLIFKIAMPHNPSKVVDTTPIFKRLKTGFFYFKDQPLMFVFGNATLAIFVCIILQSTLTNPSYVKDFLKTGGGVYAWSDMVFSAGALLAGVFSARVLGDKKTVQSIISLTFLAAVMFAIQVFNKNLTIFFVSFFIVGFCNAAVRIQRITFLFRYIPNHVIGRASSLFFMSNVFFRLTLTALFTLPFFHVDENIAYSCAVFTAVCMVGATALLLIKDNLLKSLETR